MTELVPATVFGVFALVAGVAFVQMRRQAKALVETDTSTTQGVVEGTVAVKGTAEPTDAGTFTAPLSGEDAVVVDWQVRERDTGDDSGSSRKAYGRRAAEFRVNDGHGSVLVRPDRAELQVSDAVTRSVTHRRGEPPASVREFAETFRDDHGGIQEEGRYARANGTGLGDAQIVDPRGRRRYVEEVIAPGDEVYVLGSARSLGDGEYVIEDGDGPFVLSDMDAEALLADTGRKVWIVAGATLVLGAASIYFLLP